jgi:hypothetical protein
LPIKLYAPPTKDFTLTDNPDEADTYFTVRQVLQGDIEKFQSMPLAGKHEFSRDGSIIVDNTWTDADRDRLACWLTLTYFNIVDEYDKEVFKFKPRAGGSDDTWDEFTRKWGYLYPEWTKRIVDAVKEVNPVFSHLAAKK